MKVRSLAQCLPVLFRGAHFAIRPLSRRLCAHEHSSYSCVCTCEVFRRRITRLGRRVPTNRRNYCRRGTTTRCGTAVAPPSVISSSTRLLAQACTSLPILRVPSRVNFGAGRWGRGARNAHAAMYKATALRINNHISKSTNSGCTAAASAVLLLTKGAS